MQSIIFFFFYIVLIYSHYCFHTFFVFVKKAKLSQPRELCHLSYFFIFVYILCEIGVCSERILTFPYSSLMIYANYQPVHELLTYKSLLHREHVRHVHVQKYF